MGIGKRLLTCSLYRTASISRLFFPRFVFAEEILVFEGLLFGEVGDFSFFVFQMIEAPVFAILGDEFVVAVNDIGIGSPVHVDGVAVFQRLILKDIDKAIAIEFTSGFTVERLRIGRSLEFDKCRHHISKLTRLAPHLALL